MRFFSLRVTCTMPQVFSAWPPLLAGCAALNLPGAMGCDDFSGGALLLRVARRFRCLSRFYPGAKCLVPARRLLLPVQAPKPDRKDPAGQRQQAVQREVVILTGNGTFRMRSAANSAELRCKTTANWHCAVKGPMLHFMDKLRRNFELRQAIAGKWAKRLITMTLCRARFSCGCDCECGSHSAVRWGKLGVLQWQVKDRA